MPRGGVKIDLLGLNRQRERTGALRTIEQQEYAMLTTEGTETIDILQLAIDV